MKVIRKAFSLFVLLLIFSFTGAQPKKYTAANAHSHNDYLNDIPFHRAYKNGFGSIEADIFPVNGILCVAHSKKEIQPQRTLKQLYLDPLLIELAADTSRRLKLLIDIKDNYPLSLQLLIRELNPLSQFLSTSHGDRSLMILISGVRPPPSEFINYPDYIFFDSDLKATYNVSEWKRVGLVSLPFDTITEWKGENSLEPKDKKRLKHIIDSVHQAGKAIRFWAAPDNKVSWIMQMKLGVDLIGTDKIDALGIFLRSRKK